MIIIDTDSMKRFINENEVLQINYDEIHRCVEVWPKEDIMKNPQYYMVEGVERVRYVSDGHDFAFDSSTDELKSLNKCLKLEMFRCSRMRDCYHLVRNFCLTTLMKHFVDADHETFKKVSDEWQEVCDKVAKKQDEIAERIGLEINQNNKEL